MGFRLSPRVAPAVRLQNGIELDLADGQQVVFDGSGEADHTVLSHAHADHLCSGRDTVICSALTAALASERRGGPPIDTRSPPDWVELRNAGHIAGSRAALVTDPATGRRYCYTGDLSTRSRFYLDGFQPPAADVLIIESTYGKPTYRFPPTDTVVADIREWLAATPDRISVLFGYPLGRAQKLQLIAGELDRGPLLVSPAIDDLNAVIERHRPVQFNSNPYENLLSLEPGDILVLPPGMNREAVRSKIAQSGPVATAGVSGWAAEEAYRYRGGYDVTFSLSDHCDFDELVEVVETVDPERVYTHHGFADEFAATLTTEFGYETRALRKHQATLGEF